jgi:tripartite motif-containing protein 71
LKVLDEQTGEIYVADYFNNHVVKFDQAGNVITQWMSAGTGDGEFKIHKMWL